MEQREFDELSDEQIADMLTRGDRLERIVLGDRRICDAVIERYLDDITQVKSVPVVRGYSALSALPKPKTLEDAKRIVDGE